MNSCEIWHWGVKGMKWGVRRYRNADGSLTPEGVRKYRKSYNDIKNTQKLAERSKTVNSTGISALDSYINTSALKNLEYLYNSYHALGGNGTGTELYTRAKGLPIKED